MTSSSGVGWLHAAKLNKRVAAKKTVINFLNIVLIVSF
jgi:hypothetical protein